MMMPVTNGKGEEGEQVVKKGRETLEEWFKRTGGRQQPRGWKCDLRRRKIMFLRKAKRSAVAGITALGEGMAYIMVVTLMIGAGTLEGGLRIGEFATTLGKKLADKMGEWARKAREIAAMQRRRAATRRLHTSRRRLRPQCTRSEVGWRWQRETPVGGLTQETPEGGLQQGEPGKGGPPRFFPREGIG